MISSLFFLLILLSLTTLFFFLYFHLDEKSHLQRRVYKVINNSYSGSFRYFSSSKNKKIYEKIKGWESKLILVFFGYTRETSDRFRLRFEQAGLDSKNALTITLLVNGGMIILGTFSYLLATLQFQPLQEQPFLLQGVWLLLISFICFRLFDYCLDYLIHLRYKRIQRSLSFCIDLLVICTQASFTLERSFERIAEEIAPFNPELCKEFTTISTELGIIPERTEALRNLGRRINTPTVHLLVSSLVHAEEQGVSLTQTLSLLSQELSKHRMLDLEAKAARLPVLLTIPLAFCCLPAMMLILLGPVIGSVLNANFLN